MACYILSMEWRFNVSDVLSEITSEYIVWNSLVVFSLGTKIAESFYVSNVGKKLIEKPPTHHAQETPRVH